MRCDHFNFCFAVSTKGGTRAGLRTLYFSTGIVHLSWLLSLSLSLSPSLSICFEQGVAPRRMATGEPQYWSFICPGQCDKVVMLFFETWRFPAQNIITNCSQCEVPRRTAAGMEPVQKHHATVNFPGCKALPREAPIAKREWQMAIKNFAGLPTGEEAV